MDTSFLIYTLTLVLYVVLLYIFFERKYKKQDRELSDFLGDAKRQLQNHKVQASVEANKKVEKAFELIKKLQSIAEDLEGQAKSEYDEIIFDGKREKKEMIEDARKKAMEIIQSADDELEDYKTDRKREIERNLVKLVMSVTEKVVEKDLDYAKHLELIKQAVDEVKQQKKLV